MNPITTLTDALPMPEGQQAALTLLDLDTKIVLMAIPGGTQVPEHKVAYPASVLLISGSIDVMLGTAWTRLSPGDSLAIEAELLHALRASVQSYVLVTQLRGLGLTARTTR